MRRDEKRASSARRASPAAARRTELIEAAADHLLRHGLAEQSLRPLAAALGTSDRMLLYYFDSKDELLAAALTASRERTRATVQDWIAERALSDDPPRPPVLLREIWALLAAPSMVPYLSVYFDAYGQALRTPEPYRAFLEGTVRDWVELVEAALSDQPAGRRRPLATLVVSAVRGLLLDLLTTGERERVEQGLEELVGTLARADEAVGAGR